MRYVTPREFFSRLTLAFLAAFALLFPTVLAHLGLIGYTYMLLAPFLGLGVPVDYYAGTFNTFGFYLTANATFLAGLLLVAMFLYAWKPKLTRNLCYIAGFLSAPIGLIAAYIGWRRAEEAGVEPVFFSHGGER